MVAASASTSPATGARYQRHRPQKTELHRIVRENLEAFREPEEGHGRLPSFVLKTSRRTWIAVFCAEALRGRPATAARRAC
jgi:hypothetical protein